ncbi:transmembrane protease serine 9-like [Chelonus insularis]|uniref:transmembrane protease serine 9-like n=1 Tax=Chelonus insularis TaxID=460826 RepID=UPI00158BA28C|nr:transmembrane protease serine 9-like [Chelonus insularis]
MPVQSVNLYMSGYLEKYKKWISQRPHVISDIENTIRTLSYFTAGRFSNSSIISELIYSMTNLLVLFNDCLIYASKYADFKLPQFQSQLKIWLTVVEYIEAILEVSAKKLWGEMGKWITIFIIQTFKAILRMILIHRNKERIIQNPAISPLNRDKLNRRLLQAEKIEKEGFVLKRSGKIIRSVNCNSGSIQSRIWTPLLPLDEELIFEPESPAVRQRIIFAETLYILKPLIHLTTSLVRGNKDWLPWVTALSLDLINIHMITKESKHIQLSATEKEEMIRRRISLFLYILRSPFYDRCSKTKIYSLLNTATQTIPLARYITEPIAKYLPHWQQTYFYMWSSSCVCHAKPKKAGGKPAGGMKGSVTCTCETFNNLCQASGSLDLRIANQEQTELICNPYEYRYCDTPKLTCSFTRIKTDFDLFGKHPWHVSIYDTSKSPKFIGSGVLIKKRYVLTIAHKMLEYEKTGVKLRLGEWDRILSPSCNTLEFKSSKIVIHSGYDAKKHHINDIALIKLDKEVDIAQYPHINTACLAAEVPAAGTYCVVAGWGVDMFVPSEFARAGGPPSDKLKEVTVPIVGQATCEAALKKTRLKQGFKLNKESFICAGGELGRDSCTGDGGAPLMCPNSDGVLEVVGLVVGGIGYSCFIFMMPVIYVDFKQSVIFMNMAFSYVKLCSSYLSFLSILVSSLGQTPPLSQGIVFSGTTTTTTKAPPTNSGNCFCASSGACPTQPTIDIRIVNQAQSPTCPAGEVLCCSNSQNLMSSCGLRKIIDSIPQPAGTALYGAYPWQVAILAMNNTYLGSGVLVTANHVVTAAHKIAKYPNLNYKLRLGDWDGLATNERYPYQEYNAMRAFIHPDYNSGNLKNDIAVIRLHGTVPLASSPNINTVCFPTGVPVSGTRCWVTGWGKNAFGSSGNFQKILREVDVPIVDQNNCETRLRNTRLGQGFVLDRNSFICAGGEQGKDACTGDGGAPLVCQNRNSQWEVVGIVAWGIGCATSQVPGVYMNIVNFMPWISQQIANSP